MVELDLADIAFVQREDLGGGVGGRLGLLGGLLFVGPPQQASQAGHQHGSDDQAG